MTKNGNLVLDESTQVLTGNEVPPPTKRTRGKVWKSGKLQDDIVDENNPHGIIRTEGGSFKPEDNESKALQSKVNAAGGSATVGTPKEPTKVTIPEGTKEPDTSSVQQNVDKINESFKTPDNSIKQTSTDTKEKGGLTI